jgi:hypothetical protein
MDLGPHPGFTWSPSRARTFESCLRKYYWTYYGSWGGWASDADELTRRAYILKKLTSLPMLLGSQIHERAREIATAVGAGDAIPDFEILWQRTRRELNRVWQSSRDIDGFLRRPARHPMLGEIFNSQPVSNDRLLAIRTKALRCTEHLVASPVWDEIRVSGAPPRLFDATTAVQFHGIPMFAAPDLVYRRASGDIVIVDWKTGDLEGASNQIAAYALYLSVGSDLSDSSNGWISRAVDLNSGEQHEARITSAHMEAASRAIKESIWKMRGVIVDLDTDRNEANELTSFPLSPVPETCRSCPFYELCEPELAVAEHMGPF